MTQNYFVSMPADSSKRIIDRTSHPNALHVLLFSDSLPNDDVIFDGETFWLLPDGNWDKRTEYKGHTDFLKVSPAVSGILLNLPFKIRRVTPEVSCTTWRKYCIGMTK